MEQWLFRMGVPSYTYTFFTQITATSKININTNLPEQIGRIYGISTLTDSTLPTSSAQNLPSVYDPLVANSGIAKLSLTFKYAATDFFDTYRLDQLLFVHPMFTNNGNSINLPPEYHNPRRYLPVNLPGDIDFKQSFYTNPQLLTNINAALTIHYIDVGTYADMLNDGILYRNGKNMTGKVQTQPA